jgi:hypothetical protein
MRRAEAELRRVLELDPVEQYARLMLGRTQLWVWVMGGLAHVHESKTVGDMAASSQVKAREVRKP